MENTMRRARTRMARTLLASALASVSSLAVTTASAHAQAVTNIAANTAQPIAYDIPAQDMGGALTEFARQSGLQVLFAREDVADLRAPGLVGRHAPDAGLTLLLAGSPLRASIDDAGTVRLDRARPQSESADDVTTGDDLVVTGTRIRGAVPAGANLHVLDRDAIEQTGQSTISEALRTLPQNFPGAQGEATQLNAADNNLTFGSAIDLRGLGSDATLTLINGRRMAPAGYGNFVDVSAIPLSAVQRIEVLADGASATYGSDAVGGVVNIITRSDFDGAETRLRFATAHGGAEEINASQLFGLAWDSGNAMIGYDYRERNPLAASDRVFTANSDLRALGGSNFSRLTSSPGNIIRVGSTTVSLAIPADQDGTSLSQSDLIAGAPNYENTNDQTDILPSQLSHSVFLSARQQLVDNLELFVDAFATERESFSRDTAIMANITVPQTNAWRVANNLFPGQGNLTIAYSFLGDAGPITYDTRARSISGLIGMGVDLPFDWRVEFTAARSTHQDYVYYANSIDTLALNAALASSDPATAFNPFADGGANASIMDGIVRHQLTENDSQLNTFAFKADGPLFALPGGMARAAFGAERRDENFRVDRFTYSNAGVPTVSPTPLPGERTTEALFAEIAAPLARDAGFLLHALDLSASIRGEYSETYGEAVTPKFGLHWSLFENLAFRASWGLSFKAPRFDQTRASIGGSLLTATPAQDPFADNGSTGVLILSGGNPDLTPEEAEIFTGGFEYEPSFLDGLRIEATYFDIDFANRISTPGDILTAIANPGPYAGYLLRDPSPETIAAYLALADRVGGVMPVDGIELIWDSRVTNLANLRVRGVDLGLAYDFDNALGDFHLSLNASGLLQFTRKSNPTAPEDDILDTLFNPVDWRGRAGLTWSREAASAGLYVNYLDGYVDRNSNPDRNISSWTTYDLRFAYDLGDADRGAIIALNINNVADEDPPFVNSAEGFAYDNRNTSPIGRYFALEIRQRW